jgi:hypothetical protein
MFAVKPTHILTPLIAVAFIAGLLVSPTLTPPVTVTSTFRESVAVPTTVTVSPPPVTQTAVSTVTLTRTLTVTATPYRGVPLKLDVRESKLFEVTVVDGYRVVRGML